MEAVIRHAKLHVVVSVLDRVMKAVMGHAQVNAPVDVLLDVMKHARAHVLQRAQEVLNNGFI